MQGKPGIKLKGYVQLTLMPVGDIKDARIVNLRAVCQRHAYEITDRLPAGALAKRKTIAKNKGQTSMFGDWV
jgi:hypothetical protein